jgi:hypothetical protein
MAMRFAYANLLIPHGAHTLGGSRTRPRALLDLSVTGPAGTRILQVTADTGADEIVLPERFAPALGIDLTNAPTGSSGGVGSPTFPVRYATVTLRLTDNVEYRCWTALVGFTTALTTRGLFGYAQGLQYFTSTFFGDRRELLLEVNTTYPGV